MLLFFLRDMVNVLSVNKISFSLETFSAAKRRWNY